MLFPHPVPFKPNIWFKISMDFATSVQNNHCGNGMSMNSAQSLNRFMYLKDVSTAFLSELVETCIL